MLMAAGNKHVQRSNEIQHNILLRRQAIFLCDNHETFFFINETIIIIMKMSLIMNTQTNSTSSGRREAQHCLSSVKERRVPNLHRKHDSLEIVTLLH